jgi:hypothetical protein
MLLSTSFLPWSPPDKDLADLIEVAFLSYQIGPLRYRLAVVWLDRNTVRLQ